MVDRTQAGSTYDKAWKAQKLDQVVNVLCLSQRHKNAADAFHQRIIMVHGKGLAGVEDRFNLDGLLTGSRCFEWSHGWGKAIETAHVHLLIRRE